MIQTQRIFISNIIIKKTIYEVFLETVLIITYTRIVSISIAGVILYIIAGVREHSYIYIYIIYIYYIYIYLAGLRDCWSTE